VVTEWGGLEDVDAQPLFATRFETCRSGHEQNYPENYRQTGV
jgi:hypothetical protein